MVHVPSRLSKQPFYYASLQASLELSENTAEMSGAAMLHVLVTLVACLDAVVGQRPAGGVILELFDISCLCCREGE